MSENNPKEMLSILLLGDSDVGKTCFLLRYCDNLFQEIHLTTVGLDYKLKHIQINSEKSITVKIWDTAGQERFKSLAKNFYKNVNGIAVLYDITKRKSFENVHSWISQIKEKASPNIQIVLIGNKLDSSQRVVLTNEGMKMAEQYHLTFFEASAKEDIQVQESIKALVQQMMTVKSDEKTNINLKLKKNESKTGCCD